MPTNGMYMHLGTDISLYRFIYVAGTDIGMSAAS
jgi:hypothetical protein